MPHIILQAENVVLPHFDEQLLTVWIQQVAHAHDRVVGNLTYVFCDDEYILNVNRDFLKHDYYTDIITFDYSNSRRLAGDMVISLDTVKSNAALFEREYAEELLRVVIHGVLHLCGINDKGPGEREIMERHENEALAICPANVYMP
ncbi:MAG: rRNA maturation RNase YbeY [Muribaculaceae bacterium]|nr:rRNA maturation RNase YbeY [Muribaculaceae bacterium]